jgi:hypothetical protein
MPKKRRKGFSLTRFWVAIKAPFITAGGEWSRKPSAKRKRSRKRELSTRRAIETQVRQELAIVAEKAETPADRILGQIEDEAERRFRKALRGDDLGEMGFYAAVQYAAGNMRKGKR